MRLATASLLMNVGILMPAQCFAQAAADEPPRASISGVVRDFTTGEPVADASVVVRWSAQGRVRGTANANGAFTLEEIEPGSVQLIAAPPRIGPGFPSQTIRPFTLAPGQDLENISILIRRRASISGQITDQNGEPAPGKQVYLIAREYQKGSLEHVFRGLTSADDQGKYELANVEPGIGFAVLTSERLNTSMDAISNAPLDPALRRPSFAWTYYPGVPEIAGAEWLTLRPGEHRENVDIEILRAPSYCLQGPVTFPGYDGDISFGVVRSSAHSGRSGNGGVFLPSPGGAVKSGTEVRVCGLSPGEYRITAFSMSPGGTFGQIDAYSHEFATITDHDTVLPVAPKAKVIVPVEIAWANAAPANLDWPSDSFFSLQALTNSSRGEKSDARLSELPADFDLFVDGYQFARDRLRDLPQGVYLKDVLYGNQSVLNAPVLPGSQVGEAKLQVVFATDGGKVAASVVNGDGESTSGYITLVPQDVRSEFDLADRVLYGETDQRGVWTSPDVAPGKYFIYATPTPFNKTPEFIDPLWRARGDAAEVTVSPGSQAKITLEAEP